MKTANSLIKNASKVMVGGHGHAWNRFTVIVGRHSLKLVQEFNALSHVQRHRTMMADCVLA